MADVQPTSDQYADEQWKPVPGWEGRYSVSDQGRVRSEDQVITTKAGVKKRLRGRMLVQSHVGRPNVKIGRGPGVFVHRIVASAFLGPCPEGMVVCHNNGDPEDNRLVNLRYDTMSGNMRDMRKHGTDPHLRRTHCPRGHQLTMPNLVRADLNRGGRNCLACNRASSYAYRHPEQKTRFDELVESYYRSIMISAEELAS